METRPDPRVKQGKPRPARLVSRLRRGLPEGRQVGPLHQVGKGSSRGELGVDERSEKGPPGASMRVDQAGPSPLGELSCVKCDTKSTQARRGGKCARRVETPLPPLPLTSAAPSSCADRAAAARRRRRDDDRTAAALQGWRAAAGDRCPFLVTSTSFDAWHVGRELAAGGRSAPLELLIVDASHVSADGELYSIELGRDDLVAIARVDHWLGVAPATQFRTA